MFSNFTLISQYAQTNENQPTESVHEKTVRQDAAPSPQPDPEEDRQFTNEAGIKDFFLLMRFYHVTEVLSHI